MFTHTPFGAKIRVLSGDDYGQTYHVVGYSQNMLMLGHITDTAEGFEVENLQHLIAPSEVEAV